MSSAISIRNVDDDNTARTAAIVKLLREPATHDDRPTHVECVETHISWIFLTDQFAYKLKTPVRFEFLDFSTSELRRIACEAEVRLNRRLARHVYLGVVPVTLENGRVSLNGQGAPVDWVVKMRRLPADRSLDRLIQSGNLSTNDIARIGGLLALFFTHLPPLTIRPDEHRRKLENHVRRNRDELLASSLAIGEDLVRRIHESQLLLLCLEPELFDHRVLDGRVVDGHGDLRPEHIYLTPNPTIIDCVEFSAELRQLDVLDELCFLAMECARLNADSIGDEVIANYRAASGDAFPERLTAFYKAYRACVRAKISALRADQLAGSDRQRALESVDEYMRLADTFREQTGRPVLLVVRGLTGSGKSTLAGRLAQTLEIEHLETDSIRRELFGASQTPVEYEQAIYRPENRARVYDEIFRRAQMLLDAHRSVILDGAFLTTQSREEAVAIAEGGHALLLIIHCHCPDKIALSRIAERCASGNSFSESRPDVYRRQKETEEQDPPGLPICHVDTDDILPTIVDEVMKRLRTEWASAR